MIIYYEDISKDYFSRKRIRNIINKSIYVDVDGSFHTTSKDGEPCAPLRKDITLIKVKETIPEGFKKIEGANTNPVGYIWYNNCKSRFEEGYEQLLVKEKKNE